MTVKELKESLKDIPDDYNLILNTILVHEEENDPESFTATLHCPITGMAYADEKKECLFMINKDQKDVDWFEKNLGMRKIE